MKLEQVREIMMWCTVINVAIIFIWVMFILLAGDWMYRFHGKWFPMLRETFNAIHYAGIMMYKILVFVFVIVPYVALVISGG